MNDKKKKKYISADEERKLIAKYKADGDQEALVTLIDAHIAYIQNVAGKQYTKFAKQVEYEDLVQEGKIGLMRAIMKFDLDKSTINPETGKMVQNLRLMTYASRWIISEMQNLWQKSLATHIPAHTLRSVHFNIKNQGRNGDAKRALAKDRQSAVSLDDTLNFEKSSENQRSLQYNGDPDPTFNESTKNMLSPAIQRAVTRLNEQEWQVLRMRLGLDDGFVYHMPQIAEEMNLPLTEVEHLYKRAKRILFKHIPPFVRKPQVV